MSCDFFSVLQYKIRALFSPQTLPILLNLPPLPTKKKTTARPLSSTNHLANVFLSPKNPRLLGLNVNHGAHVKLRLRRPNTDWDFYPFDEVLDTMLHELCHNATGPHNVAFYKLWDDLRKSG